MAAMIGKQGIGRPRDVHAFQSDLTEAGWAKLVQSMPLWEQAQCRFERAFGKEKARVFRATLDHIAAPEFALRFDRK
jgi:hypothetical protein